LHAIITICYFCWYW